MKTILEVLFLICLFYLLINLMGCRVLQQAPDNSAIDEAPLPVQQMYKVVHKTNWTSTFCILGIVVGLFAGLNGIKAGWAAVISCCAGLFMSLATARYAHIMAGLGLVSSVAAMLASIIMKNRAIIDLIKGVQVVKQNVQTERDEINSMMKQQQSRDTEKVVISTKAKLKLKGELA